MNFIEWGTKLYTYYFKEKNKGEEILLYVDEYLLKDIGGEDGVNDFLGIFNPKTIISRADPRPQNNIASYDRISLFNEFKSLEKLLLYLKANPRCKFTINNIATNSSDPKVLLPFIIMVLYAYNCEEGIFTRDDEKKMVGNEQNLRENVFELLQRLSKITEENYKISCENIYGADAAHRYVGVFRYHVPFTRNNFNEIVKIKNRHGIYHAISESERLETLFKRILDERFKNIRNAGYKHINNIITGEYKIPYTIKSSIISSNDCNPTIYFTPSFQISNNELNYFLRIHSEDAYGDEYSILIDKTAYNISHSRGKYFKILKLEKWPEEISGINLNCEYKFPESKFFIPISENEIWNHIGVKEYISSEFTAINVPNYFFSKKKIQIDKLIKYKNQNNWQVLYPNFLKNENCNINISIKNGSLLESKNNTFNSQINFFDNDLYIDKHIDKISYFYYFLPKIEIIKHDNENCYYRYDSSEILINSTIFDLNTIEKLQGGKKIEINIKSDQGDIIVQKTIELIDEREQIKIQDSTTHEKIITITKPNRNFGNIINDTLFLENDYLSRILYSISNYDTKRLGLSQKFFYDVLDAIAIKFGKPKLIEKRTDKQQILRDLLALKYLSKGDKYYSTGNLAFVQVSSDPNNVRFAFMLSGSRNLTFIKKIIQISKENNIEVFFKETDNSEIHKLLMPNEIYFLFRNINEINLFLNFEIDTYKKIGEYIEIIPYSTKESFNEQIENNAKNPDLFFINHNKEKTVLEELNNESELIIEGENCKLFKTKNIYPKEFWIYEQGQFIKSTNEIWASIYTISKNEAYFLFSKYFTTDGPGNNFLFIPIVKGYPLIPQEYYTELVRLNGGLPSKITVPQNSKVNSSCGRTENLGTLEDIIGTKDFLQFKIDPTDRSKLEKKLNTKLAYIDIDKYGK